MTLENHVLLLYIIKLKNKGDVLMLSVAIIAEKGIIGNKNYIRIRTCKTFRLDRCVYLKYKDSNNFKSITISKTKWYGKEFPFYFCTEGETPNLFLNESNLDFDKFEEFLYIESPMPIAVDNVNLFINLDNGEINVPQVVKITSEITEKQFLNELNNNYVYVISSDTNVYCQLILQNYKLGKIHLVVYFLNGKIYYVRIQKYMEEYSLQWENWSDNEIYSKNYILHNYLEKTLKNTSNKYTTENYKYDEHYFVPKFTLIDESFRYDFNWGLIVSSIFNENGESKITFKYN